MIMVGAPVRTACCVLGFIRAFPEGHDVAPFLVCGCWPGVQHAAKASVLSQHTASPCTSPQRDAQGSVATFDVWGTLQASGVRNARTSRLPSSRKSHCVLFDMLSCRKA